MGEIDNGRLTKFTNRARQELESCTVWVKVYGAIFAVCDYHRFAHCNTDVETTVHIVQPQLKHIAHSSQRNVLLLFPKYSCIDLTKQISNPWFSPQNAY